MCAADGEVLKANFGMSNPPRLARVLLDSAIVLSQNAGLAGRIGLHAAPAGGTSLLKVYDKCGLINLSAKAPLPPHVRHKNDGRFFYADAELAEALAAQLDHAR
jgi:hypothetical protein